CGEEFTAKAKAWTLDYYERRTVRDSSLSACTQAVMCAEVGHLELAHAYLHEAALVDLRNLQGNTDQGLHIASLAGTWTALVDGLGGMREGGSELHIAPALPESVTRLSFRVLWRGKAVQVEATHETVICTLLDQNGAQLPMRIYDEEVLVTAEHPV